MPAMEKLTEAFKRECLEWNRDLHGALPVWLLAFLLVGCSMLTIAGARTFCVLVLIGIPIFYRGAKISSSAQSRGGKISFSWWDVPLLVLGISFWMALILFILNPVIFSVNMMFDAFAGLNFLEIADRRQHLLTVLGVSGFLVCGIVFLMRVLNRASGVGGGKQEFIQT